MEELTAQQEYERLTSTRDPYLRRAREASKLTIPSLIPPERTTGASKLPTPYQAIGARGVNNLAAKLLLALLPPNTPFFKFSIDDFELEKLTQQRGMRAAVEEGLNAMERAIQSQIETSALRVDAFEGLKHLIVGGNVLLSLDEASGKLRVFHLDSYVVKRDAVGNVLKIITKESIGVPALPEDVRELVGDELQTDERDVDIYTHVSRDSESNKWLLHQEVKGKRIPDTDSDYPLDRLPYMALRWSKIDGEDYGRGYVEEYLGDLKSLEALMQALVEGSAAMAKIVFLVAPNGTTRPKALRDAPNLGFVEGSLSDIDVLQLQKYGDFTVTLQTIEMLTERLSFAFLLNTAIQRQGERVTAEEIRFMAGELEDALGGVYSILSQEFQLPLVNNLWAMMEKQRRIPTLPKKHKMIRPSITAGLEALGRGHDLVKLQTLLQAIAPLGQKVIEDYIVVEDFIKRTGVSQGIDMKGLVRTEEQVQQRKQQEQMQEMLSQMGPGMVERASQVANATPASE